MTTKPAIIAGIFLALAANGLGQTNFTKVTTGPIVTTQGSYVYGVWGDFNNDGYLDLFVANDSGTNLFCLNSTNDTFTGVTSRDPSQDTDFDHIGAAQGDYDNDGNLDVAVSGGLAVRSGLATALYHGNGDGTFSRIYDSIVTNRPGNFGPCSWVDYDDDGFLDLFVADHGYNGSGGTNVLFHGIGDGTFSQISSGAIVTDKGDGFACLWADYDNDGFGDLFVCNLGRNNAGISTNFLYHNNRDGTFTRVTNTAVHIGTDTWSRGSPGGAWGDYDNDGFQDLFVAGNDGTSDRLYHNDAGVTFTTVTNLARPSGTASLGGSWGDYDNDGYLDLLIRTSEGHNRVLHNNGNGTFTEIGQGPIVSDNFAGYACWTGEWVDYDNDGSLDLFVSRSANNGSLASNVLYHNIGNSNAWLEVKLVGQASNRSAIGAKVRAYATIGGNTFWQMREVRAGGAYGGSLVSHFGLGDATNVNTLHIEWPSGIVQTLNNIVPRQILTVVEHQSPGPTNAPSFLSASSSSSSGVNLSIGGQPGVLCVVESSVDLIKWTKIGVVSNAIGVVSFTDAKARNYVSRFYRVLAP
jgi:hypothetical protein